MTFRRHNTLPLSLLLTAIAWSSTISAQEDGRERLDEAILAKLTARQSLPRISQVVGDTQAAIDAGLAEDDLRFANYLIAATLTERTTLVSRLVFDRPRPHPQWQQMRRLAIVDLNRAIKADNGIAQTHFLLGRYLALPGGDRKKAADALDTAIRLDKENKGVRARALVFRANLESDPKKRLPAYNEAIELEPRNVEAIRSRGLFYFSVQKVDEAQADFTAAIELDAKDAASHQALGLTLMRQLKLAEAKKRFDRVIELIPEAPMPYVHRAQCSAALGNSETALSDVRKAIALSPKNPAALLLRARIYASTGDTRLARSDVERVLDLVPDHVEALLLRVTLKAIEKDYKGAIADVEAASKARPQNKDILLQRARLLEVAERPNQAIEAYTRLLEVAPDLWAAYRGRGDVYLNMGQQTKAIADYEAALKIDPKQAGVLNNLSWVLSTSPDEKLRDGHRAIELAKQACDLTEYKQAHMISTLAAGHAELGDFDSAVKWSKRAIDLGDERVKEPLRKELKSYLAKEPWRELKKIDGDAASADDRSEKDGSTSSNRDAVKR